MENVEVLTLNENVRVYNGLEEIRMRIGIWNYNEVVINTACISENEKKVIKHLIAFLKKDGTISKIDLQKYNLNKEETNNINNILDELKLNGFLTTNDEKDMSFRITNALLGNYYATDKNHPKQEGKVLLITDEVNSAKEAKNLSTNMNFSLEILEENIFKKILNDNLITKIKSLELTQKLRHYKKLFLKYNTIIVIFNHLSISFLRNLNRIIVELERPISLGFIDGPFITVLSICPPKTGCLECFELRNLSRLEDHISYQKFANAGFRKSAVSKRSLPVMNLITNLVICEGFLLNQIGSSRLFGRVINIYLPLLEIQVQDILRVPFCPACGFVSKSRFEEMNISSKEFIDDIISEAELFKEEKRE